MVSGSRGQFRIIYINGTSHKFLPFVEGPFRDFLQDFREASLRLCVRLLCFSAHPLRNSRHPIFNPAAVPITHHEARANGALKRPQELLRSRS